MKIREVLAKLESLLLEASKLKKEMLVITVVAQREGWSIEKWKEARGYKNDRMNEIHNRLKRFI